MSVSWRGLLTDWRTHLSNHSEFMARLATLPGAPAIHDGSVPAIPKLPYVLVTSFIPRVGERAMTRSVHSRVERWRTTITGANSMSVRIIAAQVVDALEGARIGGWRMERVPDDFPIWEDTDVTLNAAHPHYTIIEWRVTVP